MNFDSHIKQISDGNSLANLKIQPEVPFSAGNGYFHGERFMAKIRGFG